MYSVYEKLIELCPIIKELLVDEGIFKTGPGGGGGGGPGAAALGMMGMGKAVGPDPEVIER